MNVGEKIEKAIAQATANAIYSGNNLLCYSVSLQPHFLVWVSSLVISEQIKDSTRQICQENATEEIFGLQDEGCHFLLSRDFFRQLGPIEGKHYSQTEAQVENVYRYIKRPKIILTLLTCIEMGLAQVIMPQILESMKSLGVMNFYYVDIHTDADNLESGHSIKFLQSLIGEEPNEEELNTGIQLFIDIFTNMLAN